jgi:hypothetical protein
MAWPAGRRDRETPKLMNIRHLFGCALIFVLVVAAGCGGGLPTLATLAKDDWHLTRPATRQEIEGYASAASINRGEEISLYVNTVDSQYAIDIFRMGWYDGAGAKRMLPTIVNAGHPQPIPSPDPETGLVECRWTDPYILQTTNATADAWPSGIYLARLTALTTGSQSYIVFVVRDDARPSDILLQASVTTWQAYNDWGGRSFYTAPRAFKLSFNRPYAKGQGTGDFLNWRWELNLIRFLEREGYDVSYTTDIDTHLHG